MKHATHNINGIYRTADRLRQYRKDAETTTNPTFHDWRMTRRYYESIWSTPYLNRVDGKLYTDNLDSIGVNLGDAGELARLDHTGWYADHYQDELIKGAVVKLRTSRGIYYIPATYSTDADGVTLYWQGSAHVDKGSEEADHDEAIREAAHYADSRAEREAEEQRDDRIRDDAERQIGDERASIHALNVKTLALLREIRQAGAEYTPAVCGALRENVARMLADRRGCFKHIAELRANPYIVAGW